MEFIFMAYKHIMVAVDGSETSDLALNEAICLAISLKAHLYITHVVDEFPIFNLAMGIDFDRYLKIIREDGLSILDKAQQIAKNKGVSAETKLIEILDTNKKISEKLIQTAETFQIDLLMLGTHGRRGFRRLILGSVAEETIRMSTIPILLVHAKEGGSDYYLNRKDLSYKRILIATDGSETSDLALNEAIYLAKECEATLHILHVADEFTSKDFIFAKQFIQYQELIKCHGQEILERSKQYCQKNNMLAEILLIEINNNIELVSEKIIEVTHSLQAELLIVGTHGRSGINRFLLGSIAEEIVRRAPVPVLLVRAKI